MPSSTPSFSPSPFDRGRFGARAGVRVLVFCSVAATSGLAHAGEPVRTPPTLAGKAIRGAGRVVDGVAREATLTKGVSQAIRGDSLRLRGRIHGALAKWHHDRAAMLEAKSERADDASRETYERTVERSEAIEHRTEAMATRVDKAVHEAAYEAKRAVRVAIPSATRRAVDTARTSATLGAALVTGRLGMGMGEPAPARTYSVELGSKKTPEGTRERYSVLYTRNPTSGRNEATHLVTTTLAGRVVRDVTMKPLPEGTTRAFYNRDTGEFTYARV